MDDGSISRKDVVSGQGRYRTYPAYKDSGVEWLGKMPAHWSMRQLGQIGSLRKCNGGTKADEVPEGVPCIRYGDLYTHHDSFIRRSRSRVSPERAEDYTLIRYGDILFAASGETIDEIGMSAVNLMAEDVCCGGDVILLRTAIEADAEFMGYAMGSSHAAWQKGRMGRGITVMHIYGDQLKYLLLALPSASEQRAIADFLDRETAKIDALVAKKERLIELLQEKRSALITHAVTKGLDPDVSMKDSSVEWLGEIPARWEVKRWRHCCNITEGLVDPRKSEYRDRILIAPNHVESGTGRILLMETADQQGAISGKYLVKPGDLIFSKIRPGLNKICISKGYWLCSADMYPISISTINLKSTFLIKFMLCQVFVKLMVDESMRVAMPKVNRERLSDCSLVLPPHSEQERIVFFLDRETAKIDTLITKVHEAIERLKELRTALISAAVTGKIDVREAAA